MKNMGIKIGKFFLLTFERVIDSVKFRSKSMIPIYIVDCVPKSKNSQVIANSLEVYNNLPLKRQT